MVNINSLTLFNSSNPRCEKIRERERVKRRPRVKQNPSRQPRKKKQNITQNNKVVKKEKKYFQNPETSSVWFDFNKKKNKENENSKFERKFSIEKEISSNA